jgi:hypothetical protein
MVLIALRSTICIDADRCLRQGAAQSIDIVGFGELDEALQIIAVDAQIARAAWGLDRLRGERVQFLKRKRNDPPGSVAVVHQPADYPELVNLFDRVAALAEDITPRAGKSVAALPYAQGVLRETCVAFDRGNAEHNARCN